MFFWFFVWFFLASTPKIEKVKGKTSFLHKLVLFVAQTPHLCKYSNLFAKKKREFGLIACHQCRMFLLYVNETTRNKTAQMKSQKKKKEIYLGILFSCY